MPVDKCTDLLRNGVPCNSIAPFEINITTKGTAATVEWLEKLHAIGYKPVLLLGKANKKKEIKCEILTPHCTLSTFAQDYLQKIGSFYEYLCEGWTQDSSGNEDQLISLQLTPCETSPTEGQVEQAEPTEWQVEQAEPTGGQVEQAEPTGGQVEQAEPTEGQVEQAEPTGGQVEQAEPTEGQVEQAEPTEWQSLMQVRALFSIDIAMCACEIVTMQDS
ncbi:uncharacterized protein LOC122140916 [Cyprinus carpio]|uniref:Uncharacterized protein LOC122140916 n=1 Tax=Cyprinus carpio TaxID=7962 RepID=A0A9Q9XI18_CYPCA|nr:uncharacterized protein LOC122140916 [Cyprinus carpio]